MENSRRDFLKKSLLALPILGNIEKIFSLESVGEEKSCTTPLFPGEDRLSIEWYKAIIERFKKKMEEARIDGMLMQDPNNIIYLAGYFHSPTERPCYLWVPVEGEPFLFVPGLDRDLVETWWIKNFETYFDFPHAETGGLDNPQGTADLLQWCLKAIDKRGYRTRIIGLESEPGPKKLSRMKKVLKNSKFVDTGHIPLKMRIVKTPEEIALMKRAMLYHDKALEFARKYILLKGTDATDFEVSMAATEYGNNLLFKDIKRDGRPHTAVGTRVSIGCRTGVGTAYPHPNQAHHNRIKRGDAIQIAGGTRIGGYGGEGYRACHIEPIPDLARKMWEVHTEMTIKQQELQKAGARCKDIAKEILDIAHKAGLEKYIYHRPAHGIGMEGHQAPYLALGDETILEEGMVFSNEPGLYNPEGGYGYNHGNTIVTRKERGEILNETPLTKEWCWLKI
ncbi:MAG: Xaa-Pro peptidase family protein [Acidobacteriota bacterium]